MQEEEVRGERIVNLTEKRGGVNHVFESSYNNGAEYVKFQLKNKPRLDPSVSDWYQDATTDDIVGNLEKRALAVAIRDIYEGSPWFQEDQSDEEYLIRVVFTNRSSQPYRDMFEYFYTKLIGTSEGYTIYDIVLGFGTFFDIEFERLCNEILTLQERHSLVKEIHQLGIKRREDVEAPISVFNM